MCKNGSDLPSDLFCPKLPYENFKTIRKNIRLKINMAIGGLQPGPATLALKKFKETPREQTSKPLKVVVCQSAFPISQFFPSVLRR